MRFLPLLLQYKGTSLPEVSRLWNGGTFEMLSQFITSKLSKQSTYPFSGNVERMSSPISECLEWILDNLVIIVIFF